MQPGKESARHVFLVGAKSLGGYGGYETFINKLTECHQDEDRIQYHVACKANGEGCMREETLSGVTNRIIKKGKVVEFTYHNARCFKIWIPEKLGAAQAIYYDVMALKKCCDYIEKNHIAAPVVYIMACRVGPFMRYFYHRIHKLGGVVYLNPDGHEWKRGKWSAPIRKYWKISEQLMIKWSDLAICDSVNIEQYIHASYDGKGIGGRDPKTTYIAYGAEARKSELPDDSKVLQDWYGKAQLTPGQYYLAVGRFVPENNYETMIREYLQCKSTKDFAIITTANEQFLDNLEKNLHFDADARIKFVGTVYDQELLMKIRENAYGYFHGHEVGGTNPSLLEALGSTELNLLLDVNFNREVAGESALYWTKENGSLAQLIDRADRMPEEERRAYGRKAKQRIKTAYSWKLIADRYAETFLRPMQDCKS